MPKTPQDTTKVREATSRESVCKEYHIKLALWIMGQCFPCNGSYWCNAAAVNNPWNNVGVGLTGLDMSLIPPGNLIPDITSPHDAAAIIDPQSLQVELPSPTRPPTAGSRGPT